MVFHRFEDIIAWQKAQELAVLIYNDFSHIHDFGFKNQICRAAVSISNNITEGYARSSDADFRRFLYIAIGSCSELKSMIYLGEKLGYLSTAKTKHYHVKSAELARIIYGLIKSLNE